jgi:hypothetical protein
MFAPIPAEQFPGNKIAKMKIWRIGVVFCTSALPITGFAQTADQLVRNNIAARGGAPRLRAVRSMAITGTIRFGKEGSTITVRALRPEKIREDFTVQGTEITRGYDGATGWLLQQKNGEDKKLEILSGGDADNIRDEAENAIEGPLLDYVKKKSKIEAIGRDTWQGKPVYKLKIRTHIGADITQFLDAKTYLEIHEEIERTVDGRLTVIVEDVGDYRDVGGIKFAHRFVSGTKESPGATLLQIEKMKLNVPLDASLFAVPK